MKFHGNYCGPNWSAGREQESVESSVPAVDDFDSTCKEHDASYANRKNMTQADYNFFKQNIGKGVMRSGAAIAVGAFGRFYHPQDDKSDPINQDNMNISELIAHNNLRSASTTSSGSKIEPMGSQAEPKLMGKLPTYIYDVDNLPPTVYNPYNPPSRSSTELGATDEHIYRNKSARSDGSEFNDIDIFSNPRNLNSAMQLLSFRSKPKRRMAITPRKRKGKMARLANIMSPKSTKYKRDFWEFLDSLNQSGARRALFD
jgi:hypothetical protein